MATPAARQRPRGMRLASRYALFAAIGAATNILAQAVTLQALRLWAQALPAYDPPFHLTLAMAVGTVAGLLPKYLLDSHWIFHAASGAKASGGKASGAAAPGAETLGAETLGATVRRHARDLPLYALTSVFTTFIFWGFEYLFAAVGGGDWRYVGALVGLAIGYRVKYSLDRDFVFRADRG